MKPDFLKIVKRLVLSDWMPRPEGSCLRRYYVCDIIILEYLLFFFSSIFMAPFLLSRLPILQKNTFAQLSHQPSWVYVSWQRVTQQGGKVSFKGRSDGEC